MSFKLTVVVAVETLAQVRAEFFALVTLAVLLQTVGFLAGAAFLGRSSVVLVLEWQFADEGVGVLLQSVLDGLVSRFLVISPNRVRCFCSLCNYKT